MSKEYDIEEISVDDLIAKEPSAMYSYADYLKWTFDERVEIIKGKIFRMSPGPNRRHQQISASISVMIGNHLNGSPCEMYYAPFDVRLPKNPKDPDSKVFSVVQPDLVVICNPEILDDKGCNGAPDFVIEILSPSTAKKDLSLKHSLYEENGVKEYWVVYPTDEIVEVYLLTANKFQAPIKYTNTDLIEAKTVTGLSIQLKDVFGV